MEFLAAAGIFMMGLGMLITGIVYAYDTYKGWSGDNETVAEPRPTPAGACFKWLKTHDFACPTISTYTEACDLASAKGER